jgi:hypothetical protein
VWASVWCRWEGQIDCRSEGWQGLVGSPLHQVSRDVGSPGGLEGGATLSRESVRARNYAVGGEAERSWDATGSRAARRGRGQQHTSCLFGGRGCGGDKNGFAQTHVVGTGRAGKGALEGRAGKRLGHSGWHAVDDVPPDARPGVVDDWHGRPYRERARQAGDG